MRRSVSCAKVSVSESARSTFARETVSPGMVRIVSPAASSVVSISESAVESHAASGRPETFFMEMTATDRRGVTLEYPTAAPLMEFADGLQARVSCLRVKYQPRDAPPARKKSNPPAAKSATTRLGAPSNGDLESERR